ncbi:hypothetical protein [Arthrobacter sp. efr-133-R2A-120]|uniref:hypothetical protein n=1 Tax=Arthrobacter sp. efr-133-R2A-120 TaxID=3040277 RepID=UPI00254A9C89|nr:hypothetical protein [Arthrobacter sp. efr-133-R2A-120]
MSVPKLDEVLHDAALKLEEDVDQNADLSESGKAFLSGIAGAWKLSSGTESGGFPVDGATSGTNSRTGTPENQGSTGHRPENFGLADRKPFPGNIKEDGYKDRA